MRETETFDSDQQRVKSVRRYTIRFMPGITEKMRIVDGGEHYDIVSVVNLENRNEYLVIDTELFVEGQ